MQLKEYYMSHWTQKNYQFQFHKEIFDEKKWDYRAVEEICLALKKLKNGDKFKFGRNNFIVRDNDGRYIIAATKTGKTYTIVDTISGLCGPSDRIFQMVDFNKEEDVKDLLAMLGKGEVSLSYRHSIPVNLYISI